MSKYPNVQPFEQAIVQNLYFFMCVSCAFLPSRILDFNQGQTFLPFKNISELFRQIKFISKIYVLSLSLSLSLSLFQGRFHFSNVFLFLIKYTLSPNIQIANLSYLQVFFFYQVWLLDQNGCECTTYLCIVLLVNPTKIL